MNKYTYLYFFALLAVAYSQSVKSIPAAYLAQVDSLPSKEVPASNDSGAKKIPASTSKAPPSEFLGTNYVAKTVEPSAPKTTKTVPPEILTSLGKTAGAQPTGAAQPAVTGAINNANNTANESDISSASKVTGTFFAAIIAVAMTLF